MPYPPNRLIEDAFLSPTVEIIRRIEIYEKDGTTAWHPEIWAEALVGGSINVASDQDNRRSADFELYNVDNVLLPEPGEFWYDKIIKAFYGIVTHLDESNNNPKILIVEEQSAPGQSLKLMRLMRLSGILKIDYNPLVSTYDEVSGYDILISVSLDYTRKLALLTQAYNAGKSILTFNLNSTAAQLPLIISNTGSERSSLTRNFENISASDSVALGWDRWSTTTSDTYRPIIATSATAVAVESANTFGYGSIVRQDTGTGVWLHTQMANFDDGTFVTSADRDTFINYLKAIVSRADTFDLGPTWESQVGEFMIESISDSGDVINNTISITCKDYTKRCQLSKLTKATMFKSDQNIVDIIKILAANSGITKMRLPVGTTTNLGKDTTYERDQDRWSIIKEIAQANSCDVWFDHEGYFCVTTQNDPLLTPATLKLTTGERGNLISRGRKTSDANLFNHVTVVGESSDTKADLVFAEAINSNSASPASTVNIGYRTKNISSSLVTTQQQAQEIADTMLSVSALEEFELTFSSILLPWIEAGEIIEMNDDDENWGPARYLITSLTLPFDLSPMSGSGKRVNKL